MAAINSAGLVDKLYPVEDTLFFKLQGDAYTIKATSKVIQEIVKKHGSSQFAFAATDREAEELWQNRKYCLMSSLAAYPGKRCWTTDVWYEYLVAVLAQVASNKLTIIFQRPSFSLTSAGV